MLFKNIAHVGSFKHFLFVYLRMVNGRGEDKRRRNQGGAPDSPIDHDEDQDGGFGGHLTSVWVEASMRRGHQSGGNFPNPPSLFEFHHMAIFFSLTNTRNCPHTGKRADKNENPN